MRKLVIIIALAAILCGGCKPKEQITLKIPGTTAQITMRLIPSGSFVMGSPILETDRKDDEGPQHPVTISEAFYIGVYEVTQEQWLAVMGTLPSHFGYIPGNPVEMVSWYDCQDFVTELNTKGIGLFRLPTEAEWEFACRAGSLTRFYYGDDSGYTQIGNYAWYNDNSYQVTHLVGQRLPNELGLYDIYGNVWEWCFDWYGVYDDSEQTDPQGATTGSRRVIRGGGWVNYSQYCRSACRNSITPTSTFNSLGFRLVRAAP